MADFLFKSTLKYFVCPHGMIKPEELPADVGLMYVTKNEKKLRIVKKSPHRGTKIPESILWYIIYYRASKASQGSKDLQYWREFLTRDAEIKAIGHSASKKIKKDLKELRAGVRKNTADAATLEKAKEIVKYYNEITGQDISSVHHSKYSVSKSRMEKALLSINTIIPATLVSSLRLLATSLERLRNGKEIS